MSFVQNFCGIGELSLTSELQGQILYLLITMLRIPFNQFDWFIDKQEMAKKTSTICNFTNNCTIVI